MSLSVSARRYYKNSVYKPLIDRYVKTLISALKDNVLGIVLFGSVARGTANPNSDIDMLVLLKKKSKRIIHKLIKINIESYDWRENQILLKKGIYTKIFDIKKTEPELRENPLLLLDILDHGIVLYDPQNKVKQLLADLAKKLQELGAKKVVFEDGKWYWDLKPDWKPGEIVEIKL